MARVDIKGEQHPVSEVFSERYAFVVPPYQRPYAWTTEHASELYDDLMGYLGDADTPVDELSPYFLGSIVLIKGDRPEAQIVDGQQRLITLTILLAALRAVVPAEYAESITRRLYEPADPLNNVPARYRLRPKERDAGFFQQFIQSENAIQRMQGQLHSDLTESQRNMYENGLLYLRLLREAPEHKRVRLAQFLAQRCLLVVVSTPDLSSAYRIFSVLNDRGLDLSYADILKAEVIGQLPEVEQSEYTLRWEQVEESLGREAFNDLIGHIRSIYRHTRRRNDILDSFRQDVIRSLNDSRRLIDEVLVPYGGSFYVLQNASYQHSDEALANKINQSIRWLNRADNAEWVPPALLYLQRHHGQAERLARFFADLERLAASLMLRRQYRDKREQRYWRIQAAILHDGDLLHPDSPLQLPQHEREDTKQALGGEIYLMPPTPRNYLLQRLDSALAGSGATYDYKVITVEHVLPRNPPEQSEWMEWFPSPAIRARWTNKLGNLALLSRVKNMQAENYSFATKKNTYFATKDGVSPFALTTQVLREKEWTPKVIERRQQELIGVMTKLWRL